MSIRNYTDKNPELSWKEFETTKYIVKYLKNLNEKNLRITTGTTFENKRLETGVVAVLKGGIQPGQCIMLRADIDALPMKENNPHLKY